MSEIGIHIARSPDGLSDHWIALYFTGPPWTIVADSSTQHAAMLLARISTAWEPYTNRPIIVGAFPVELRAIAKSERGIYEQDTGVRVRLVFRCDHYESHRQTAEDTSP